MSGNAPSLAEKISGYPEREREKILLAAKWTGENPARLETAAILIDLGLDADTVMAALLQDPVLPAGENVEGRFGHNVALLAEGIARITSIAASNKTVHEAENIRKMLFAMVSDIRVIFIKLADRLYRMRTLEELPPGEQKLTAQESLDIYAPLAGRLGISWIKDELEDLSLKHLNREAYVQIKKIVAEKRGEREDFLRSMLEDIGRETAAARIDVEVKSRAKHFYSIYQKMRKRNKAAEDIYDLFGVRILCGTVEQCYTILGLVHRLWKPLEGRFKDYIAMPKSNGYQSLHTTVMSTGGRLLEIQIRTQEMHHIAEYGIASHWLYKQRTPAKDRVRPLDISIVNRLRDWKQEAAEQETDGSGSFLEDIKREILKDSIYVFTPQGKVIELPVGATPIDFAYSIHSAVGERCMAAKADGTIIPLSSELQNTQVVEILTSTSAHPHLNWLRIVKTAKARTKIRIWLQQHDESLIIEKNVVARKKVSPEEVPGPEVPGKDPPVQRVINPQAQNTLHVKVEDERNMMIRFAQCCRPITGDPIIGYVSRGRGIIIHRRSCGNLTNIAEFEDRKIDVEWENTAAVLVKRFVIEARSRPDLFSEIESAVRKHQGHLIEGRLEETSTNRLTGFFTVQLEQAEGLKKVMKNIRGIPGVLSFRSLS